MENKKVLLRDVVKDVKDKGIKVVKLRTADRDLGTFNIEDVCKSPYYDSEVAITAGERSNEFEIGTLEFPNVIILCLKYESFVIGKSTTIEVADNIFEYMDEDKINPFILWLIGENFKIDDEANLDKGVAYKFEKVPYSDYQKSEFFYHRQRGPELYHWRNKDYSRKEMEKIYDELKPYNIRITEYEV